VFSAEAHAICLALDIVDQTNETKFTIFSDSMSSLQAIHFHKWTNPTILYILEKCQSLLTSGKIVDFCWIPSHVGIKGNEDADAAAKAALQLPISNSIKIPYTDLKQSISTYFISTWQYQWNQSVFNKLYSIKPVLGETKLRSVVTRRDEVVLHRARIGHTHLTHCYLLKGENAPDCASCHCLQTVQHILIDCPLYQHERVKFYRENSLDQLFNKVQPTSIVKYLKEIQLYSAF
jgi:hypothetical protein